MRHVGLMTHHLMHILEVSSLLGKKIVANLVTFRCDVLVGEQVLTIELIIFYVKGFDAILGMD